MRPLGSAWSVRPVVAGAVVGVALPLAVVAPAVLWGHFERVQAGANVYYLLPLFALLALPGALAGSVFAHRHPDRRRIFRFATGLLLGGWLGGALLLFTSTADTEPLNRLGLSLFGGVMLVGFWMWLGGFIGGYLALEQRERSQESAEA